MRGLWTVTYRELREWRPVVWLSLALLGMGWAIPWMPGVVYHSPGELRSAASIVSAALMAVILSLLLGSSIVGREASSQRLGFYLTMPLSPGQVWFGKVLAASLVLYGSIFVVQLPSMLGESAWMSFFSSSGPRLPRSFVEIVGFLLLPILLFLLTHAIGLGLRARSPWSVVDLVGLFSVALLINSAGIGFLRYYATDELVTAILYWLVPVVGVWLLAGYLQISRGRGSLRRGHCWLTITGWSLTLILSLGLYIFSQWIQGGSLAESPYFVDYQAHGSSPWVVATGPNARREGHSTFLFNTATGSSTLANPMVLSQTPAALTEDGTVVYAVRFDHFEGSQIVGWNLGEDAVLREMPLLHYARTPEIAASSDRLAVLTHNQLELFQTEPWEKLGQTDLPESYWLRWMTILPTGTVRVVLSNELPKQLLFYDFDGSELEERVSWEVDTAFQKVLPIQGGQAATIKVDDSWYWVKPDSDDPIQERGAIPEQSFRVVLNQDQLRVDPEAGSSRVTLGETGDPSQTIRVSGKPSALNVTSETKALLMTHTSTETHYYEIGLSSADSPTARNILSLSGKAFQLGPLQRGLIWMKSPGGAWFDRQLLQVDFRKATVERLLPLS